jgi:hypothetical protein
MFEGAFYLVVFIAGVSGSVSLSTQMISLEMENEKSCELAQRQMDKQIEAIHTQNFRLMRYFTTCVPKNEKKEKE